MNESLLAYLCPPGNGVYTVNTAKEKKQALHQRLFNANDSAEIEQQFSHFIRNTTQLADNQVGLLGVCSDNGGGIQRGANWGPLYIREKLYASSGAKNIVDLGDIRVIPHLLHDKYLNQATIDSCQTALYGGSNDLAVSPLSIAEEATSLLYQQINQLKLISLGGDHSVSYPLVKAYLKAKQGKKIGLIHFDAHTDLLIQRLGIDLCFGSWLTHVLPYFESPAQVIQLGIRSSGKPKQHWHQQFGITQHWAQEIKQQGMKRIVEKCLVQLNKQKIDEIYISFDIDALDASVAAATGTPEPDGLLVEECIEAIEIIGCHYPITGADCVEVAPMVNPSASINEPESTLNAANIIINSFVEQMTKAPLYK